MTYITPANRPRFAKGDLVVTLQTGRRWDPETDQKTPEGAEVWRCVTAAEVRAWRDSPESKGMNCAGETKLPPQHSYRRPAIGTKFIVVRGSVKARQGWHEVAGCALIRDADGVDWFVERHHIALAALKAVEPAPAAPEADDDIIDGAIDLIPSWEG